VVNDKFVGNLERLYGQVNTLRKEGVTVVPNTRILLGFANKMIEQVKVTQTAGDFISE